MTKQRLMISTFSAALLAAGASMAADHPGQKFQIFPANLAKPYATPATGNESNPIPRPAGAMPEVPQGFAVSLFADKLTVARWMAVAPNGDVFLAEPSDSGGKITVLRDSNGDGKADKTFTFVSSGFVYPHGLAFHDGYLYVGDLKGIWRIPYKDGQTVAGAPEKVTTKVADLRPRGNHVTRDIAFGPDGGLYLAFGSRDNISDFKPGAQVFKINPDGSMSEFASGIRNPVGIAFAPGTGTLYVTTNERDGLGDDLPPDYFTSVKPGGFYGYPYAYTGTHPDPVWGPKDPAKVASSITPDVLFHAPVPTGATGAQALKQVWTVLLRAFPGLHVAIEDLIAEGDKVVARNTVTGTHQGEYHGVPPTGKSVTYHEIFILRFAGGQIAEIWGVVDLYSQLRQLGLIPA